MARERRRIWKENITIKLMMINEGKNEKMKKTRERKKERDKERKGKKDKRYIRLEDG